MRSRIEPNEEDRSVTPPAPRTDSQLFPRPEAAFQRSCRGSEQQSQCHHEKILSFRKLFANDRALFANDGGDKHPNLNKHKGSTALIRDPLITRHWVFGDPAALLSVCSSSSLLNQKCCLQKTHLSSQLNRISGSSSLAQSLEEVSRSRIALGHLHSISVQPGRIGK